MEANLDTRQFIDLGSKDNVSNFFIQYISTILIILCIIVAISETKSSTPLIIEKEISIEKYQLTDGLQFTNLFVDNGLIVNEERYLILKSMLSSHDIFALMRINSINSNFDNSILKVRILLQKLYEDGIPRDAVKVVVHDNSFQDKITVTFQREKEIL